ncbi:MAG: toll/interleukin-1 receptor domain-containing protein [Acidimicrobiales bacterium]
MSALRTFICYRRVNEAWAGRLADQLSQRFGRENIFVDDNIRPGQQWVDEITTNVTKCDVLLAVIGKQWLTLTDDAGVRRLDKPNDWVRFEIKVALENQVGIIPVLIEDAEMPEEEQLPEDITALSLRQASEIRGGSKWAGDVRQLIEAMELAAPKPPPPPPPRVRPPSVPIVTTPPPARPAALPPTPPPPRPSLPVNPTPSPAPTVRLPAPAPTVPATNRTLIWVIGGVLAVILGVGALLAAGGGDDTGGEPEGGGAYGETHVEIIVPARRVWTDTGLDVKAGTQLDVVATGEISSSVTEGDRLSPDGVPDTADDNSYDTNLLHSSNHASLIGSVGEDGEPFAVGSGISVILEEEGRLFLGINDAEACNNAGEFQVTIRAAGEGVVSESAPTQTTVAAC